MRQITRFATLFLPALFCAGLAGSAEPAPQPFADAPPELRAFFIQARQADAIADPLQRCLAMPDLPANKWPAGLGAAYCRLRREPGLSAAALADYVARADYAGLEALYQHNLDLHFSATEFSERIHRDFDVFVIDLETADRLSRKWLENAPDSAFANAARAYYYARRAKTARGGALFRDTPQENIYKMHELAAIAFKFFDKAVRIQPRLIPAFAEMTDLAKVDGQDELFDSAYRRGAALDPGCNDLVLAKLSALRPNWGGSIQAMQAYARQLAPLLNKRPLLAIEMALPAAEAGSALYHQDKFGEALKILRPAAAYTAKVSLYHDLASSLYFEDGDIWQQLLYYVQAYRFDDGEFAVALIRGRAMYMTQQFDWAEKSLLQAIALKPDDTTVNYFLGANYVYLKRYEKAEPYLLKGLTDPDNHGDALYQMATAQAALHRWDQAERYAARLNREFPEFSAGWLQMAQIKDAMQRPAEVPALLERYLQLADPATPFNIEWMAFARSYLLNVKARSKAGAGTR